MTNYNNIEEKGKILEYPINTSMPDFSRTQTFVNRTRKPIAVTYPDNLIVTVNPEPSQVMGSGVFIIRVTYTLGNRDSLISFCNNIDTVIERFPSSGSDLVRFKDHILNKIETRPSYGEFIITLEKAIPFNDIVVGRYCVMKDEGIMLCLEEDLAMMPHPNSVEGRNLILQNELSDVGSGSGVYVEIIDNENRAGPRYHYTNNQVIETRPIKDKTRKSGVYLTKVMVDEIGHKEITTDYKDFDSAKEDWGFFLTKEEALTGGNPAAMVKKELEEANALNTRLKHQIENIKLEIEHLEATNRKESLPLLKTIETLKLENLRLKEEMEHRSMERRDIYDNRTQRNKDYYEERSYIRKDNHELLKTAALLLGVGVGVFKLFSK